MPISPDNRPLACAAMVENKKGGDAGKIVIDELTNKKVRLELVGHVKDVIKQVDLGNGQFAARTWASAALEKLGPSAEAELRIALKRSTDAETKRHIEELLIRHAAREWTPRRACMCGRWKSSRPSPRWKHARC